MLEFEEWEEEEEQQQEEKELRKNTKTMDLADLQVRYSTSDGLCMFRQPLCR
jgi:hypothetical protein